LDRKRHFSIIQIGAYVGATENDPLNEFLVEALPRRAKRGYTATVVLIEPVRDYFERLRQNYVGIPFVHFVNAAVTEAEGRRALYRIDVDPTKFGYPEWLAQLSSLKEDRVGEIWDRCEKNSEYKEFLWEHRVEETVDCIPFARVLASHDIQNLDFLQIDAEGYDYEILRSIDFSIFKPTYVNYERELLLDQETDCRKMMREAGYSLTNWGQDTFCTRHNRRGPFRRAISFVGPRARTDGDAFRSTHSLDVPKADDRLRIIF
jgi:FkbM family methyltransferase